MKAKAVISFRKRFDPSDGTVYNQAIRIGEDTFNILQANVKGEIEAGRPNKDDYAETSGDEFFLQNLERYFNVCFMNCTQTRFVNQYLGVKIKPATNVCLVIDKKLNSLI